MKLQLALDRLNREQCFEIIEETKESIDIIEVGTGVIKEYGMKIVRDIKERYPLKTVLADMKTCDAGKYETLQAIRSGADITTVMAFSANKTISDSLQVVAEYGKQIMVDLLDVRSREKIVDLIGLGVSLVSLHVGKDKQESETFETELFSLIKGLNLQVAVAGGITLETLPNILLEKPDIVIVGSAITKHQDPRYIAMEMKKVINQSKWKYD